MDSHVIIVAGGEGSRMKSALPKQFLLLNQVPVIIRTILQFHDAMPDAGIVVVLPEDHMEYWTSLIEKFKFNVPVKISAGGSTRFASVKNGLERSGEGIIGVHDAVRPLVSKDLINRCFDAARDFGSAIPVTEVTDTIRLLEEDSSITLDRKRLRKVQTPQCFRSDIIKNAYSRAFSNEFTDCASVVEAAGIPIQLVEGDPVNFKITYPFDLFLAELMIKKDNNGGL